MPIFLDRNSCPTRYRKFETMQNASVLNAPQFIAKIFLLTSIWVTVEHNYEFYLIRTIGRVLNITSLTGCLKIRYLISFWTYVSCLVMIVFAYSLIDHIGLYETVHQILFGVGTTSLFEKSADEKKLEWMILVIISHHLMRLQTASLQTGKQTVELFRRLSLIGFALGGYLCGFWRIVYFSCFFVHSVELIKLLCRACQAVNDRPTYRYTTLLLIFLTHLGSCWAYMFLYRLPLLFIHNLIYFENSKKIGTILLLLFRINFLALIILSAIEFPYYLSYAYPYVRRVKNVNKIVNRGEPLSRGLVNTPLLNRAENLKRTVRERVPTAHDPNAHIEEKVHSKKMEQRAAVGQIIRCIVTLKRKAKEIRKKKEKLMQQTMEKEKD